MVSLSDFFIGEFSREGLLSSKFEQMNLNLHGGKRELKSTASYQVQAVTGGIRKVSKYIRYLLT